jgi:uncharacterized protein (TIGR03032 family)
LPLEWISDRAGSVDETVGRASAWRCEAKTGVIVSAVRGLQVDYSQSGGLVGRLGQLGASVAISSYQFGLLYMLGRNPSGGLHVHQTALPKPMGLAWEGEGRLTVAGGMQVLRLENVLAPHEQINSTFDACFVPRRVHATGALDAHDVGVDSAGRVIFVNTRFNCLATLSDCHSFTPIWRSECRAE